MCTLFLIIALLYFIISRDRSLVGSGSIWINIQNSEYSVIVLCFTCTTVVLLLHSMLLDLANARFLLKSKRLCQSHKVKATMGPWPKACRRKQSFGPTMTGWKAVIDYNIQQNKINTFLSMLKFSYSPTWFVRPIRSNIATEKKNKKQNVLMIRPVSLRVPHTKISQFIIYVSSHTVQKQFVYEAAAKGSIIRMQY